MPRLLCSAVLVLVPGLAQAEDILVFAASSLKAALDPVALDWAARTGNTATISYGSSATLAKQIEEGAPADVIVSAAVSWMDYLQARDLILTGSRVDLWGNALSLIAHDPHTKPLVIDASSDLAAVIGDEKLAMGLVDSVPVGQYGKAALVALGQWTAVEPMVVQTQDARATVALVATGEAGFGIVYATDAMAAEIAGQGVEIARLPAESHRPIIYPGAIVATSTKAAADAFLADLASPAASDVFAAQGYAILTK